MSDIIIDVKVSKNNVRLISEDGTSLTINKKEYKRICEKYKADLKERINVNYVVNQENGEVLTISPVVIARINDAIIKSRIWISFLGIVTTISFLLLFKLKTRTENKSCIAEDNDDDSAICYEDDNDKEIDIDVLKSSYNELKQMTKKVASAACRARVPEGGACMRYLRDIKEVCF